ncbi:iron-containing redox enzyme family protein [Legionella cardiaca]|uniref:Iron-containing redox enzyme family protein n=1 Tax=Legionella cardiaca TaxID=1071983 RepID=A0ABY8AYB1_9GAMM|nr:iron-containing redox enzyme family protein [Legionella cardiaca]WED44451.1 iron-containing redox enzyme family protein [Legionella cardiaca]
MSNTNVRKIPSTFAKFLEKIDDSYRQRMHMISLFDKTRTSKLSDGKKNFFAGVFYHLRGHFIEFMWYVANFSNDEYTKKIILENIHEELGPGTRFSHEKLYENFAKECQVDIHDEIVNETHYLPFAKEFNKGHLRWLATHDADERLATFAAYERLDNIDYHYLTGFAQSLNLSSSASAFFHVHMHVEHFESTIGKLAPIWEHSEDKVKNSFNFIYSHQLKMWEDFSDIIFA